MSRIKKMHCNTNIPYLRLIIRRFLASIQKYSQIIFCVLPLTNAFFPKDCSYSKNSIISFQCSYKLFFTYHIKCHFVILIKWLDYILFSSKRFFLIIKTGRVSDHLDIANLQSCAGNDFHQKSCHLFRRHAAIRIDPPLQRTHKGRHDIKDDKVHRNNVLTVFDVHPAEDVWKMFRQEISKTISHDEIILSLECHNVKRSIFGNHLKNPG